LSVRINDTLWTLVAVYGPNNDEPQFFTNLQRKIESLGNSSVIIVGDWNVPLNYSMDTLNYMHKNNEKGQKQIHFMMEQLDLVDSFRELNPDIKRYAWRGPAKKQARLDLFLFSSYLQLFIHESNIGIAYTACPFTYCSMCCTYNKNHARLIERTLRACT
jgi:exonuclease III